MDRILLNSKFCFGPMSKNIVDAIIDLSNRKKIPITLIPSRRQIDYNKGYVNNWNTKEFSNYVKENSQFIAIQRDHGGPGQGSFEDDGYESLKEDCKYFDSIHIDPWKKFSRFEESLKWTIDMINFCFAINPKLFFEVGTEEAIRKITVDELSIFLDKLKSKLEKNIFDRILFCVIQSGTSLNEGKNTGNFCLDKLNKYSKLVKKYGMKSKEHNGDFMDKKIMKIRFENSLDSINIAPELGIMETKFILSMIGKLEKEKLYELCYQSGKWKKWVNKNFEPHNNKIKLIEITCHYIFSDEDFIKIKNNYGVNDIEIVKKLKQELSVYFY